MEIFKNAFKFFIPPAGRLFLRKKQTHIQLLIKVLIKTKPIFWGSLRRLTPISKVFGLDRGKPIDRYYIEKFLLANQQNIKGIVLEIGDNTYTKLFGGENVLHSDVLHVISGNPMATVIADLTSAEHVKSDQFDCIILVQTLQFIYDLRSALKTVHRILKPGGVLLVTTSGISQISRYDMNRWGEYWRFTTLSAQKLFGEFFSEKNVSVQALGNVLVANAFLHGLSVRELKQKELDFNDPDYQMLITIRAFKDATF